MNPSISAHERSGAKAQFMSLADLSTLSREKNLYPKNGSAVRLDGSALLDLMQLNTFAAVETRINDLARAIAGAANRKEKESTMTHALEVAKSATSDHELHYLGSMFINYREVMRALSRNNAIGERTQRILATDSDLSKDPEVRLGLAHNQALTPEVALLILNDNSSSHVENGIAMTAAHKSMSGGKEAQSFADICRELARSYDSLTRSVAITGITDPEVLREIANNNSVILASRELEAVASNKHTPDDVLQDLTKRSFPSVQPFVAISVAAKARSTLAAKNYQPEQYTA